jgi:hypothetical protein
MQKLSEQATSDARQVEAAWLGFCVSAAQPVQKGPHVLAQDERQANVLRVAGLVIQSRFPQEAKRMLAVGNAYLSAHPDHQLHASEVIRRGWVTNLPRLRDMLSRSLTTAAIAHKA